MTTLSVADPVPVWRESKRPLWPLGIVAMGLPLYGYALYLWTGLSLFWWYAPIFVYGVLPLLDAMLGEDMPTTRPTRRRPRSPAFARDPYYRWMVYLAIPAQYGVFVWGAWMSVSGNLIWHQWLGLMFSVGFTSGLAINVAHELGHQTDPTERWLAKIALAPVLYGNFYVEHNRGHHVRVATPEDPASARFGESFWSFLPRCVGGSLRSAWRIETRRMARQGKRPW